MKVVHINQLDPSIDSVIGESRLIDEDDNNADLQHLSQAPTEVVTPASSGQSTVVVSSEQKDLLVMEQDMVQFANPIEDQEHDAIEHELFKVSIFSLINILIESQDEKRLGKYLCDLCPSVFTSKAGLNDHVKSFHLGEKRFACEKCGKMVSSLFGFSLY